MSFLDKLFLTGIATAIKTPTQLVDVSSDEPTLNQILKITSTAPLRATWEPDAGGLVSTVFGRSGAVVAALNDYAASLVQNDSAVSGATVKAALETLAAAILSIPPAPVSSVFGRTGAIAATLGDYVASKITNDSSVSGATTKDALNALLAAIPSVPVSSVFGRTGAIAATAGDYTTSKITNNSSVSGATSKDALETLQASIAAGNALVPYIVAPATPNAFDDEFSSGSADLATRGYTVVNASGTTLTRSGDINPWDATGPAGNTYWSTIIGSWLFFQGAPGVQVSVYKTITLAAGDTYFCRMVGTYNIADTASSRFNEFGLYLPSGAALDDNNRVFSTVRDDTSTAMLIYDFARLTGGVAGGVTGRQALGGHDIRGVHFASGTTHQVFAVDAQNGQPKVQEVTGCPAAASLTRVAFRNLFTNTGGRTPQICGIDFFRKKTSDAWLIP